MQFDKLGQWDPGRDALSLLLISEAVEVGSARQECDALAWNKRSWRRHEVVSLGLSTQLCEQHQYIIIEH